MLLVAPAVLSISFERGGNTPDVEWGSASDPGHTNDSPRHLAVEVPISEINVPFHSRIIRAASPRRKSGTSGGIIYGGGSNDTPSNGHNLRKKQRG